MTIISMGRKQGKQQRRKKQRNSNNSGSASTVQEEWRKMWYERFPKVLESERYITDKEEIIASFIERFEFCHQHNPNVQSMKDMTQRDLLRIQIIEEAMRELYEDATKLGVVDEINQRMLEKKSSEPITERVQKPEVKETPQQISSSESEDEGSAIFDEILLQATLRGFYKKKHGADLRCCICGDPEEVVVIDNSDGNICLDCIKIQKNMYDTRFSKIQTIDGIMHSKVLG